MGKKSRRNKKNNGGPLRKGLDAVPTAAAPPDDTSTIFMTVHRLMKPPYNIEKILKIESKYCHLDTFSDDPVEDAYVLTAFGRANYDCSEEEACHREPAIDYFERAKERMEDANGGDRLQTQMLLKSKIGFCLPGLYSNGRDMEKAISSHRWLLENCSRHEEVTAGYVLYLSSNLNQFEKFEYAIEILEGSMDMMKTFEDEVHQVKKIIYRQLIHAYIGCGEFLKAKGANKKRRSFDMKH